MDALTYYQSLPKKRVGSGALFFNEAGELLIVKPNYKEYWLIPGGVINENEPPLKGCLREIKEEIGLEIDRLDFIGVDYTLPNENKTESFQFIFNGGVLTLEQISRIKIQTEELDEFKFIKVEAALLLFSEWFRRRILKCLEAIKNNKAVYLEDGN